MSWFCYVDQSEKTHFIMTNIKNSLLTEPLRQSHKEAHSFNKRRFSESPFSAVKCLTDKSIYTIAFWVNLDFSLRCSFHVTIVFYRFPVASCVQCMYQVLSSMTSCPQITFRTVSSLLHGIMPLPGLSITTLKLLESFKKCFI